MIRPRRNNHRISVAHRMFFLLVQDEFRLPLFDAEELVDMRMHFVTNVFTRPQAHHNKLRVRSGEEHLSKIRVLRGLFFDRPNVSSHVFGLLQVPNGIASFRLGSGTVLQLLNLSCSWRRSPSSPASRRPRRTWAARCASRCSRRAPTPVSYTHLTLPTKR